MNKLLGIIVLSFLFCFSAMAKVKSNDLSFPKHFYTNNIKACSFIGDESFKSNLTKNKIESLIKLDWMNEWAKGNSRSVNHENLTTPMSLFAVTTHTAIGNNDKDEINLAKNTLTKMASANFLFDTISRKELKNKPRCWKNGNPEAPCWYHAYEFARDAFTNYLIIAIYLKEYLTKEELKIVDTYIKKCTKNLLSLISSQLLIKDFMQWEMEEYQI